ncbi:DUF4097 family beta strand repeat-containing protein [Planococcus dechangensis]|uniref:DUF4097 family beta strand repeat-containing protein n=1 Tax=Planococcus dechangensis TaxID=1176255 RepID=UPI00366A80BC
MIIYKQLEKTTYSEEAHFKEKVTDITIEANNETIEIVSTKDLEVKVELTGSITKEIDKRISVNVKDGQLTVLTAKDEKLYNGSFFREPLGLIIYLPEKRYNSLLVRINQGSVQVGKIEVKKVRMNSGSGNVDLKKIKAKSIIIESDHGKVNITKEDGDI